MYDICDHLSLYRAMDGILDLSKVNEQKRAGMENIDIPRNFPSQSRVERAFFEREEKLLSWKVHRRRKRRRKEERVEKGQ